MGRPVRSQTVDSRPLARIASHRAAVRRHCQTTALATGRPVSLSHTTAVSRWFVIPKASIWRGPVSVSSSSSSTTSRHDSNSSAGSCSTHPGCGLDLGDLPADPPQHAARGVDQDGRGARGPLVDGEDVPCPALSHRSPCDRANPRPRRRGSPAAAGSCRRRAPSRNGTPTASVGSS